MSSKPIPWPANNINTYVNGLDGDWGFMDFSVHPPIYIARRPTDDEILDRWGDRLEAQKKHVRVSST